MRGDAIILLVVVRVAGDTALHVLLLVLNDLVYLLLLVQLVPTSTTQPNSPVPPCQGLVRPVGVLRHLLHPCDASVHAHACAQAD